MCTVTYVPLKKNQFILTQNRDEGFDRPKSLFPNQYTVHGHSLLYPKDPVGNGTWMATSNNSLTACLMNGAFEKHKRMLPYKKSRGLVLLDIFKYNHVSEFINEYSFDNIEPFTIIAIDKEKDGYEIVWDEQRIHIKEFSLDKHHIWSSSTLYNSDQKKERHKWFFDLIKQNSNLTWNEILNFHLYGGKQFTSNGILMKREKVGSVSITSVNSNTIITEMNYMDVLSQEQSNSSLKMAMLH